MSETDLSFMDYDPPAAKKKQAKNEAALSFMDYDPPVETVSQGGALDDVVKSVGQGALQLPGAVTGLADIPAGLLGFNRPYDQASDALGKATGFQPGKWADETTFSPGLTQARANVDKVWDDKDAGALDVAKAYAQNPSVAANLAAQSVPSLYLGGIVARGLGKVGQLSGAARGALGEGTVIAGQSMEGIDAAVDPRTAALTSLGVGALGAGVGAVGGKLANRAGVGDPETLVAGGARQIVPEQADLPAYQRVPLGIGLEAGEEVAQSTAETGLQNLAEGKPFNEGLPRAQVEGGIAGGLMGGASNLLPQGQAANPDTDNTRTNQASSDSVGQPEWTAPAFKDRNYQAETKPFFGEPLYNKIPGQTLDENGLRQPLPKGPLSRIVPQTQVNKNAQGNIEQATTRPGDNQTDAQGNRPAKGAEQNNETAYQDTAQGATEYAVRNAPDGNEVKAQQQRNRQLINHDKKEAGQPLPVTGNDAAQGQGTVNSDNRVVGTGGLASAESTLAGSHDKNAERKAKTPAILSKTKTGYIKAVLKQQGITVKSPTYKAERDKLLNTYAADINQARFSLPFEQFKKLKANNGVSEELLFDSYQNGRANLNINDATDAPNQQPKTAVDASPQAGLPADLSTPDLPLAETESTKPSQATAVLPPGNEQKLPAGQADKSINRELGLKQQEKLAEKTPQGAQVKQEKLPYLSQKESDEVRGLAKEDISTDYLRGRFGTDRLSKAEAQAVFDAVNAGENTGKNTAIEASESNIDSALSESINPQKIDTNKTNKDDSVNRDNAGLSQTSQDAVQGRQAAPDSGMDKGLEQPGRGREKPGKEKQPDEKNPLNRQNNERQNQTEPVSTRDNLADTLESKPGRKKAGGTQATEKNKAAISKDKQQPDIKEREYRENEALRESVKQQTDKQFVQKVYDINSRLLKTSARDFARHSIFKASVLKEKDGKFYLLATKKATPVKITKPAFIYGKAYQANLAAANRVKDKGVAFYSKQENKRVNRRKTISSTVNQVKQMLPTRIRNKLGKSIEVVQSINDVTGSKNIDSKNINRVEGLYHGGNNKIYLIADNLADFNLMPVLAHELLHQRLANDPAIKAKLDSAQAGLRDLFDSVESGQLAGAYADIYKQAMRRVKTANTPKNKEFEEFIAYAVTQFNIKPQSLPARLKRLIQQLIGTIRAQLLKAGFDIRNLTPADLSALAMQPTNITLTEGSLFTANTSVLDSQPQATHQRNGGTAAQIKARLPRRVKKLLNSGKLQVVSNNNELPDGLQSQVDSNVQALYQESSDTIYLIAENLAEADVTAVLNHELFHRFLAQNPALKEKLIGQQGAVLDAFTDLYDTKYNQAYRPMMREAMRRVIAADTKAQHKVEELAAYLVELYSENPQSIPAKLRKRVRDLVATIKGIALRAGIPVSKMTPADLAALARRGAKVDNKASKVVDSGDLLASKSATNLSDKFKDFRNQVAKILKGGLSLRTNILISATSPEVFTLSGMNDLPVAISAKVIDKAHYDHGLPIRILNRIPELIADPVMVFESDTENNGYVIVTDAFYNGKPVIVAIHADRKINRSVVNFISTSLPKDNPGKITDWIKSGLLKYINKSKTPSWSTAAQVKNLSLAQVYKLRAVHSGKKSLVNISTEKDLVKKTNLKFSKAQPKDIVSAESVSNILGELFTKRPDTPLKNEFISMWRKFNKARKRHQLGVLSVRQLLEVAKHTLPGLSHDFQFNKDAMDANVNALDSIADKIYSKGLKLEAKDRDWMSGVAHEATIAGVDPAEGFENTTNVPEALKDIEKHREEIATHIETVRKTRGKIRLRPGDAPELLEFIDTVQREIRNRRRDIKNLQTSMAHDTSREKQYLSLKEKFDMLPDEAKAVYREVRDFYETREAERKQAIIERIEDSALRGKVKREAIDKVKALWEQNAVSKPYFPLTRHGQFWLSFKEGDESNYMTFESTEDMDEFIKENPQITLNGQGKYLEGFNKMEGVNAGFVTDVDTMIKEQLGESPETADLRDAIYQRFLESLPAMSMRKHQIHRKNVQGFSNDLLRSFAKKSGHDARQTARIIYGHKLQQNLEDAKDSLAMMNSRYQMQQARIKSDALTYFLEHEPSIGDARALLKDAPDSEVDKFEKVVDYAKAFKEHGDMETFSEQLAHNESLISAAKKMGGDFEFASNTLDELGLAYQDMMNPSTSPVAQLVNSIGFTWFLGLSPAAALVNTLQVPGVSVPFVGAKYGMRKTTAAFTLAYKDFFSGKNNDKEVSIYSKLTKDEKDAYEVWHKQGLLDKTRTHDLMQAAEQGIESGKGRRLMSGLIGGMFHHAERSNREVTAIATYRLAREAGESHEQAIKTGEKMTWDTHLDYNSNNRARAFRGNAARVMTQFKQYSQGMTFLYYKTAFDGLKSSNLSKEEKTLAKKQLAYMLGAQFAVAGAAGLPLGISGISLLMALVEDAFDDEDEPFDLDLYIRTQTADLLGNKTAEALTKGVSAFLPMDIHSRLEQRNMWIRGSDRDQDGRDEAYGFTKLLLGPTGGLIENFFVGKQLLGEDKEWRGVEKMMPKAFRDIMKAIRYAGEDVENLRGDRIYETDAVDVITQSLGFSPQRLSERYGQNNAIKTLEKTLSSRRGYLIARAANAKNDGDRAAYKKALDNIKRFNTVWKDDASITIPMKSVFASARTRKRYSENADNGIIVSKRYRDVVKQAGYLN